MNRFKQFITARSISLGLILMLTGVMYISTLVPQQIDSTPGMLEVWRSGHADWLWLVDILQLHSIYGQPWFAAIILCAALSLGVSSYDQLAVTRRKLYSNATASAEEIAGALPGHRLESVARTNRYRIIKSAHGDNLKFIKNSWGYFGVMLLHVGITLVILVSLFVSLTGRQGALMLVEGEQRDGRQPWNAYQHGLMVAPLQLPGTIRLDRVRVYFDDKNRQMEVSSDISFTDQAGRTESLTASINRIQHYRGLRIYHAAQYGDAFTVTFTDSKGTSHVERIMVQQAMDPAKAGYSEDFSVSWSPFLFDAKYFADADRKSMLSTNPELFLRMLDGGREIARTSLTRGVAGTLGEYMVKFDRVEKWSKLIIVDITGMSAIFAGFAIIMLGGLIHYMAPPRELIGIRLPDGNYDVYWKAAYFRDFFVEERDQMIKTFKEGNLV